MGTLAMLERRESAATTVAEDGRRRSLLSHNNTYGTKRGHGRTGSGDSTSTATSATTSTTFSEGEMGTGTDARGSRDHKIWSGEMSSVIGLQKRGLRGLMEGRRARERANTAEGG